MTGRARMLLVSLFLFASAALVPTPVFGADAGNGDNGSAWRSLSPVTTSLQEMVRTAKPMRFRPTSVPAHASWATKEEVGAMPSYVRPTKPVRSFQSSGSTATEAPSWQAGPINYTRFEITDPSVAPFVQHGKIFIFFGSDVFVCSGTIVPSLSKSLVLTAGHCLVDPETGADSDGAVFIPGYKEESAPFGQWDATNFQVTDQWKDSSLAGNADARFDIGALLIETQPDGSTLEETFGARGVMFNVDFRQAFDSFGYPANPALHPEFDGEHLFSCESAQTNMQDTTFNGAPFPTGMGCDMTEGSSGGGWVINEEQNGGFVNSVVSYSYPQVETEVQYGPYFGTTAQAFYEEVSGIDHPDPEPGGDHEMNLSIRLRKHLVAKGVMTAVDGYTPCAIGAPIGLFKFSKKSQTFKFLKETVTTSTGTWKIRVADRTGHYAALGPEGAVDEQNFCLEAVSKVVRHRH